MRCGGDLAHRGERGDGTEVKAGRKQEGHSVSRWRRSSFLLLNLAFMCYWRKNMWHGWSHWLIHSFIHQYGLLFQLLSHVWLLCDPMDCSTPGSSVHGMSQKRILEWVAVSFARAFSLSRDWTWISCIGRQMLYCWATGETLTNMYRVPHIWQECADFSFREGCQVGSKT